MKPLLPAYSRRLGLFTALVSAVLPAHAFAQSVWTGASDNEFSSGANWSPSAPGTGDAATVDTGSPQVTTSATVGRLQVGGGNVTITNTGNLTATDGSEINSGSVSINAGGVLNSNVDLNGGSLSVDGALAGRLTLNNGNVTVNGSLGSGIVGAGTSLSNNGVAGDIDVSSGGTFVNNTGATADAVTNAGTASNAGTIGSLTNTAGNFTNNTGGRITGKTTVAGGTVTNNFVITDADVAAVAAFVNNNGATAGAVRNAGTVTNAGTIAAVRNEGGTFTNNFGGRITGATVITGGMFTNNATVNSVDIGTGGTFTNATGAVAGPITNSGNTSNAGTVSSLRNTGGTFTNNAGGRVSGNIVVTGGTVTNNFVITDADVAAVAAFVNNSGATAGVIRNAGTVTNAGTVASLENNSGTFTNNAGGNVTGTTEVNSGRVVNNAALADVDVGPDGRLVNNSSGTAGTVTNAGIVSNDGAVASLVNTGGIFSNTGMVGTATVSGGALINDGTISGSVDVDDGGLLSGSGSIGGLLVNAGGVLSPGPGIATLAVNGDVAFRPGSTYQVDIEPSGPSDRVNATGTVDIGGGTLDIRGASGTYGLTNNYTILTAASITGAFDDVTSHFAFLSPTLSYGATAIDLDLDRNAVRFADVADTENGRATAAAVEALRMENSLFTAVLPLDAATASSAFSQLSGEVHASLKSALLWQSRFPRESTIEDIAARSGQDADEPVIWSSGFFSADSWSGDGNAAGFEGQAAGIAIGADTLVSDQWRIGGLIGYSRASLPGVDTDSYHVGLYTSGSFGPVDFVGGAIYSHDETSTSRDIAFATFNDRLTADYASATSQLFADLSWTHQIGDMKLQPFANLAYVNLDTDGFKESGGAAALSAAGGSDAIATSTLGIRWSLDEVAGDMPFAVTGMLGWRHTAGDTAPYSSLAFAGGTPFFIEGIDMPSDTLVAKIGVTAAISKSARLVISYSGEFGKGMVSNTAQARLSADF